MSGWDFSKRQTAAWDALHEPDIREVLYGGAKGGGKSVFGVRWSYLRAREIIDTFELTPTKHPLLVGFMGRQQSVDFNDTTLETWKKFVEPSELYEIRSHLKEVVIDDTVKINYGGLGDQETIQKFNSAEYAFIFIDQAEEIHKDDMGMLRGTLRLKIKGRDVLPKVLLTANPAQCWLKPEFIQGKSLPHRRFIKALPSDNPFLHTEYIDRLREAFSHRPELLEAYLHGSWDDVAGHDRIIKERWVREAGDRHFWGREQRFFMVFDAARFGDDETVVYTMRNTDILDEKIYGQKDAMHTANLIHTAVVSGVRWQDHHYRIPAVGGDSIGIGGPILDRLREMSGGAYSVYDINVSEGKPMGVPAKYLNRRAQIWDEAAMRFSNGEIELHNPSDELVNQLTAPRYEFRNGRMKVEEKVKLKMRLGRSPDQADAYIMGLYMEPWVEGVGMHKTKRARRRSPHYHITGSNAMAM